MFGKIVYIGDNVAHVKIGNKEELNTNVINYHVMFEDSKKRVLGEVGDIDEDIIKIRLLGEIVDNNFVGGVIRKPNLNSNIRIITQQELDLIMSETGEGTVYLGKSPLYDNYPIRIKVNELYSNHAVYLGNSGSGKSYGVARIIQNILEDQKLLPFRANIFLFDAYGEYHNAFKNINTINPNYRFKYYTTNERDTQGERLRVPIWFFDTEDMALLLNATKHSQLPIIERMLKIVRIFAKEEQANEYKNHLIAKAIMAILFTNQSSSAKKNDVFSILSTTSTPEFNTESPVHGIGYVRKLRECFVIDSKGEFSESILLHEYVSKFIREDLEKVEVVELNYYTLDDLEKALNFTLISEGLLRNEQAYADAISLKVRLHSIVIGEYAKYLDYSEFITRDNYVAKLVTTPDGRKAQIVNFNLEDVEDWFAKVMTKFFAKMLFAFTKSLPERATIPFHIFLEEAHRYVQNDTDNFLLGYNIFERVAKEGRKYGLILNLISQRPVEISETVISQCSNFIIFKMTHPRDLDYIKKMLPNISSEVVEKQKSLQPGTCVAFGKAFKIPLLIKMDLPNPEPYSSNSDVYTSWTVK